MHLLDEFSWTVTTGGGRVRPVTYLANNKHFNFDQIKLGLFHGEFECDHVNRRWNDFRSCNIRAVTKWENLCNRLKGIGKIKRNKDGSYTATVYTSQGNSKKFDFATYEGAASFKKQWDDEHFSDCTYERSQRIAEEHAFYYNSWIASLNEKPTRHDKLIEEIGCLSEKNLYKILFRRVHGWYLDLMHDRTIKFGDYEINGINVNGRDMPLNAETCYLKMLEILDEYAESKNSAA